MRPLSVCMQVIGEIPHDLKGKLLRNGYVPLWTSFRAPPVRVLYLSTVLLRISSMESMFRP